MKCLDEVHTETQTQNQEMSSYFQLKSPVKVSDISPQSSMDIWKTITLPNFHDRLTPPPPPIDHRYMADCYTNGHPQSIEHVSLENHYSA